MNEDFVPYELAVKLKEKGFTCKYPLAMYNELGVFHPLYTSCDETLVNCTFGNRGYYDYDDFDEYDFIAPTISQVLKWLREEKKIYIQILFTCPPNKWEYITVKMTNNELRGMCTTFTSYEQTALAGIEYVLDNFI